MHKYRVSVTITLKSSVDIDDAKDKEEAIARGIQYVADAFVLEDYAIGYVKIEGKGKAARLSKEKSVRSKYGKTKKSKK